MLSKFTVLACYCIYFSKTQDEYARMFWNIVGKYRTIIDADIEIEKATKIALNMMQPDWKNKARGINISTKTDEVRALLEEFDKEERRYKDLEAGGRVYYAKLSLNKLDKLRDQINTLGNPKNNVR